MKNIFVVGNKDPKDVPHNPFCLIGLYGKEHSVLVGYKRIVDPKKAFPNEAIRRELIKEYSLTQSFQESMYQGRSLYDLLDKEGKIVHLDVHAIMGMTALLSKDAKVLEDLIKEGAMTHRSISGFVPGLLHKAIVDTSRYVISMSHGQSALMEEDIHTDLLMVDATGEMYALEGHDAQIAGTIAYSPGVKRRLEQEWCDVGRPRKVSLDTRSVFVAGTKRNDIETYLRGGFSSYESNGSLTATKEQMILGALDALRRANGKDIKLEEAHEIEIWAIPRFEHLRYGDKGEIGGKINADQVREMLGKLAPLPATQGLNFLPKQ